MLDVKYTCFYYADENVSSKKNKKNVGISSGSTFPMEVEKWSCI